LSVDAGLSGGGAGAEAVEARRLEAGVPLLGSELGPETIPNESAWLVERSVSFDKGCYVGQELVARVDSRGNNTPFRVRRLSSDAGPIQLGDLYRGDDRSKVVGQVTSAGAVPGGDGRHWALGRLARSVEPGDDLVGVASASGVSVGAAMRDDDVAEGTLGAAATDHLASDGVSIRVEGDATGDPAGTEDPAGRGES